MTAGIAWRSGSGSNCGCSRGSGCHGTTSAAAAAMATPHLSGLRHPGCGWRGRQRALSSYASAVGAHVASACSRSAIGTAARAATAAACRAASPATRAECRRGAIANEGTRMWLQVS